MARTAVLGGEVTRRGLLGRLSKPAQAALVVALVLAVVVWWTSGTATGGALGVVVLAAVYGVVVPWPWLAGRSAAEVVLRRARFRWRRHTGMTTFTPALTPAVASAPAPAGPGGGSPGAAARGPNRGRGRRRRARGWRWSLPHPLGRVEPLELAGTGQDDLFILAHTNAGEPSYLSVVLEVGGQASGLRSETAYERAWVRYGQMLAELAKAGSHIRGLQQLNRITPVDVTPHRAFIASRLTRRRGLGQLISSYEDLIEVTAAQTEQHHNYLVARIPLTRAFVEEARRFAPGPGGWAALVREELAKLARRAQHAELTRPRVLGEQRSCALLRSLQDPRYPIDQHAGVRWATCWQAYTTERDCLRVNEAWYTRTAFVPREGIVPLRLGPRWLAPLLTQVTPAVIRTLSVRLELVPAAKARGEAVADATLDAASVNANLRKGRISEGTDETLLSASQRRLHDLQPGSGHHGVRWSMALSVTAADSYDLRRACAHVADVAGDCGLSLQWQDHWHDAAVFTTYPLARGMALS